MMICTVAAPPSIVVKCEGWFLGSGFFVRSFMVLFLSCAFVCDLFLTPNPSTPLQLCTYCDITLAYKRWPTSTYPTWPIHDIVIPIIYGG